MHDIISWNTRRRSALRFFVVLFLFSLVIIEPQVARAVIGSLGNITNAPNGGNIVLEPLGYGITGQPADAGDLIVGDRNIAGVTIDVGFDPGPLISPSGVVGNQDGSFGRVSIDGFPSDWLIGDSGVPSDNAVDLIVGNEGTGIIDLFDSAQVQVGSITSMPPSDVVAGTGVTVLGRQSSGFGQVTLTNVASRLVTADLTVGDEGEGDIFVQSRAALYSASAVIGNEDGSIGTVTLADSGTNWFVGDTTTAATLTVGNGGTSATTAYGFLNINNNATLRTSDVLTVNETGTISLGEGGKINDIALTNPPTGPAIEIFGGVIRGDGFVHKEINNRGGEIRNQAALIQTSETVTSQREKLVVSGAVMNLIDSGRRGLIETIGGEMEFHDLVTNNADIVVRDGILRFRNSEVANLGATFDLDNVGTLILGNDASVYGNINVPAGGSIITTNGTALVTPPTITGNVTFTSNPTPFAAASTDRVATGSSPNAGFDLTLSDAGAGLTIIGDLDLADVAELLVDYVGEQPLEVGDVLSALSVTGSITGSFASSEFISDGFVWGIDIVGNDVMVEAVSVFTGIPGDFDFDGDVDGSDFLALQRNGADSGDLSAWQGGYSINSGGSPAVVAALPEPASLVLALFSLGCCLGRRRS